jgi:hypothetical protein
MKPRLRRALRRENPEVIAYLLGVMGDPDASGAERFSAENMMVYATIGRERHKLTVEDVEKHVRGSEW